MKTTAACHYSLGSSNGTGRRAATDEPSSAPLSGMTFQLSPHLTKEQADEAVYWVKLCGGRLLTPRAGREEAVRAPLLPRPIVGQPLTRPWPSHGGWGRFDGNAEYLFAAVAGATASVASSHFPVLERTTPE